MFNVSGVELAIILVVALLLLGPQRLPEVARGLGKFLREFRRQTDEVRTMVEREFYQMDQDIQKAVEPAVGAVRAAQSTSPVAPEAFASGTSAGEETALPGTEASDSSVEVPSPPPVEAQLYDAEYHAAEATGLLPPAHGDEALAQQGRPATPRVEAIEGPAAPQSSSPSEPQEPTSRAK